MYPPLLQKIDRNNRDWLRSWGCLVIQLKKASICNNPDHASYNGIFAINTSEREAAVLIKEQARKIQEQSGYPAAVWLDPYCQPANLPQILEELGYQPVSTSSILHAKPTAVAIPYAANLAMFRVSGESTTGLGSWMHVYINAFDRWREINYEFRRWEGALRKQPSLLFYFGLDQGGQPVVCGQLITTHEIGGLYSIGTMRDYRHRGYGSTMAAHLAGVAEEAGLKDLYLIATNEENKRFWQHLGFNEIMQSWTYMPS